MRSFIDSKGRCKQSHIQTPDLASNPMVRCADRPLLFDIPGRVNRTHDPSARYGIWGTAPCWGPSPHNKRNRHDHCSTQARHQRPCIWSRRSLLYVDRPCFPTILRKRPVVTTVHGIHLGATPRCARDETPLPRSRMTK